MTEFKEKLQTKTILYVEDDLSILEEYSQIFSIFFKEAFCVDSAIKGLEYYKQNEVDIILTDITLPHFDGIEFAKMVKEISPNQKIIALSGVSVERQKETNAFDEWILKPVDIEELFDVLSKVG